MQNMFYCILNMCLLYGSKSRAIRMKKNINAASGHKTIKKLTNKQKMLHKKKKIAEILQKAMK